MDTNTLTAPVAPTAATLAWFPISDTVRPEGVRVVAVEAMREDHPSGNFVACEVRADGTRFWFDTAGRSVGSSSDAARFAVAIDAVEHALDRAGWSRLIG